MTWWGYAQQAPSHTAREPNARGGNATREDVSVRGQSACGCEGRMLHSVLVERLLFICGLTLLTGSVLQYRAATAGVRDEADEPFTLPGVPLAQLRPLAVSSPSLRALLV